MLSLTPVVKAPSGAAPYPWAASDAARHWIPLNDTASDAEVALVVAVLAAENSGEYPIPAMSIAEAVGFLAAAEGLVVDGGLLVRRNAFTIEPGCCGDLADWRGWVDLAPGALTPWMGHAPAPWVATEETGAVIYADGGAELGNVPDPEHVRVSYLEIETALNRARTDLEGFQIRLEDWLSRHAPENTGLAAHFRDAFVRPPESGPPAI